MKKIGQYVAIIALSTSLPLASAKSDLESSSSSHTTIPAQKQTEYLQLSKKNTEKVHSTNTSSDSEPTGDDTPEITEQDKNSKKIAPDIDLKEVTEPPLPVTKKIKKM